MFCDAETQLNYPREAINQNRSFARHTRRPKGGKNAAAK